MSHVVIMEADGSIFRKTETGKEPVFLNDYKIQKRDWIGCFKVENSMVAIDKGGLVYVWKVDDDLHDWLDRQSDLVISWLDGINAY